MSYEEKDLFLIIWGLNKQWYFMAKNSDMARLYLRNYPREMNLKGTFTLYKVDKNSFKYELKDKLYYVDSIFIEDERIEEYKKRIEKAIKEKDMAKQLKILFEGRELKNAKETNERDYCRMDKR